MLDRIMNILKDNKDISDWRITQNQTEANELYLIKNQIGMTRSKNVNKIALTVYKDFEENGSRYRGSSTINIHPTMTDQEIAAAIAEAAFASSFIKNQYYPLPENTNTETKKLTSKFDSAPLVHWMPKIKDALFASDTYSKGYINSGEIFLNKNNCSIINSRGIHHSFVNYTGNIELITNWTENQEEIELFKELTFSDYEPEFFTNTSKEMLELSREKAATQPTPNLGNFTVILRGEPVAELLKYYYIQANAQSVYQQVSMAKPNESIQGENIQGDKITMILDPVLPNSAESTPVDEDGIVLAEHKIIENSILLKYWGSNQYSFYLGVEPTGKINNYIFQGGSKSLEEMRQLPHLEIAAFSDFSINTMTSDFAGEIRLGWYYDGKTRITVSGGSISGNLNTLQTNMYLSKELQQCGAGEGFQGLGFKGPKALMLHNVSVAGN